MYQQKICIIGDGLAGLATAAILSKENLSIDLYASDKKNKNIDSRTTAISDSNYLYIKNILNLVDSKLFWSCKKIDLFFEEKGKIINFLNFSEKKKNFMHIFQNRKLKIKLKKIISQKKNIKLIKRNIKNIDINEGSLIMAKKKIFYDLIILSVGSVSKLYDKIESGRSIKKNYEELAITATIKHDVKIKNMST